MPGGRKNQIAGSSEARRPTELDLRLGELIRERRLTLELRQTDLAAALGITQHQLQKYETGENRIAASRLVECARVLEVPVAWFYHAAAGAKAAKSASDGLAADERSLLETYRQLPPEKRAQLSDIAKVLASGRAKPK